MQSLAAAEPDKVPTLDAALVAAKPMIEERLPNSVSAERIRAVCNAKDSNLQPFSCSKARVPVAPGLATEKAFIPWAE
jgi:hypothetical protein